MIFRSWVWFRPPQPPINTDRIADRRIKVWSIIAEIWNMMDMGAIFCHVSRIMPDGSDTPWVTSGTQK